MKKLLGLVLLVGASVAFAEEGDKKEILLETIKNSGASFKYFAYFLAMGLAALGGTSGQGRAAAAALEGICRNPAAADKVTTPMILSFAFMESLVIFTLISIFLT